MDLRKRLFRRPWQTVLWLALALLMSAFLTAASSLWLGARSLASALDARHTAIAVRTDRAVTGTYEYRGRTLVGAGFSVEDRRLERAELDWLEAQPSVKAVRIHSLTGGWSRDFESVLGLRRESSFTSPADYEGYRRCLVAGTVLQRNILTGNALLGVEAVLCLHPELEQTLTRTDPQDIDGMYRSYLSVYSDTRDPESSGSVPLEVGGRYLLSGQLYPTRDECYRPLKNTRIQTIFTSVLVLDPHWEGEEGLWLACPDLEGEGEPKAEAYPAVQALAGEPGDFLKTHPVWSAYQAALDRQLHSLPVLGTDRLETLYMFVKGEAEITAGRSFTPEEYETGARVMVLSEAEAAKQGLQPGDKITMAQFLCGGEAGNASTNLQSATGQLKWPAVGPMRQTRDSGPEEEYELVGLYRLSDYWSLGSYAFTPDTVFLPKKAQIAGAWGPESEDLYGVYLSVELVNGMLDDFRLALANSPYAGKYYTVDQGFEQVQRNLNDLWLNARRLAVTALAAWGIFVLLYLMMYQAGQRRNLGILRSQGSGIPAARRYLFLGGLVIAAAGVTLGTALGGAVLGRVEKTVLSDMLAQVDQNAAREPVISEENLKALVKASSLGPGQLVLLGAGQLGVLALILWAHAAILARKNPRRLMEV